MKVVTLDGNDLNEYFTMREWYVIRARTRSYYIVAFRDKMYLYTI